MFAPAAEVSKRIEQQRVWTAMNPVRIHACVRSTAEGAY
jgi:hypothetical protein